MSDIENKVFYFVRDKDTGALHRPKGVQHGAPHLYDTLGKAECARKRLWSPFERYEVVGVVLTEVPIE